MKKVLCTFLSCCMLLSCLSAFAADSTDVQMQNALAFVKSKVDVPQELDKFSYQKNDSETYGGKTAWSFYWTNADRDTSISVECVGDEQIIYYQYSANTDWDSASLAKVTKEQAEKNALDFLDRMTPASIEKHDLLLTDSDNVGSAWSFSFIHMVDFIPVIDHVARLNISKETGEVTWFSGFYENGSAYPDSENGAIGIDAARGIFAENIGLRLVYRSYYDYRKETLTVFPAYVLNTAGSMVMADGTVKQLSSLSKNATADAMATMESGGGSSAMVNGSDAFTPQELDQIQQAQNLLTKEQAVQKVTAVFTDAKDAALKSASLSQDTVTKGQYIWVLRLENENQYIYASVDAGTGEIMSFNSYSEDSGGSLVSEETAKKALDTLLNSICGTKIAQSKLQQTSEETVMPLAKDGDEKENPYYTVRYVRQVNGIDYENNTITATYNRSTGKIESYQCIWYPDAVFPDISNIKPQDDMMALLFDELDYSRIYRDIDGIKYFGYDFPEVTNAMFDPFTATRIGYDGQPFTENDKPYYTDINNHWCCDMALSLLDNDVYFKGGTLNPDAAVTQEDFLRLLYQSQQLYADDDTDVFYKDVVRRGILPEEDVTPAGTVSRAEAARYIIRIMGYDKAAALTDIYIYPFSDYIDAADLGYVTLCYGFGIVKGDESGFFNPDKAVTRAETISMIYHKMLA